MVEVGDDFHGNQQPVPDGKVEIGNDFQGNDPINYVRAASTIKVVKMDIN